MDEPWRLPAEVMCRVQREETWYSGQRGCILRPCQGQNGNPGQTMSTPETFRVGFTADLVGDIRRSAEHAVAQIFDPLPNLEWDILPDTGGVADAEVNDRYDALVVLGYYFPPEAFAGVKRLACVSRWGVGFDRVDVPACTEADVLLSITPNAVRRPVAEGIITLILAVAKDLRVLDIRTRRGDWRPDESKAICIEGRTLGSVGVGNIAGELFRMARGMGFGGLLGYDPFVTKERAAELGVELVDLPTLMRESDFVTINAPLNEHTEGLVGAEELALMKPSAYLVNTARGPVVDEKALIEVLRQGKIAGAGLDVFEEEPVPTDNPLLELDNVIVAPHSIAWTEESVRDLGLDACRNVREVYEGKAPAYLANPKAVERPGVQAKLARRKS